MLEQVLQQTASKSVAKSNQRQRQILARRLSVLGMRMESSTTSSRNVMRELRDAVVSAMRKGLAA